MTDFALIALHIQGGVKVGLHMFVWKRIQYLMNNNTRINSELHVLKTINLLLPNPVFSYYPHVLF